MTIRAMRPKVQAAAMIAMLDVDRPRVAVIVVRWCGCC